MWHQYHVFPRLATVAYFLAFGISYNFSGVWYLLHVLPRSASVTSFPLLGISNILCASQLLDSIGKMFPAFGVGSNFMHFPGLEPVSCFPAFGACGKFIHAWHLLYLLYCSSSKASIIQDKLIADLSKINHWLSFNSLFINVSKTEAMLFGTAPRLSAVNSFSITLNNNVIKRVFHFTYLGIVFDDRLSWNEHIKDLISKAGKRVGMLGRLRRGLTRESANIVYCSLIRPILEYCVSVWGCCGVGHKQDLEALQNRAARIVARTVRSNPAMDVLKWLTLEERRRKSVFKLVKKCLQGQCPQYFKEYFKRNNTIHARATRQSNLLHPPAVRTEIAKRSFYYYGCTLFNELS